MKKFLRVLFEIILAGSVVAAISTISIVAYEEGLDRHTGYSEAREAYINQAELLRQSYVNYADMLLDDHNNSASRLIDLGEKNEARVRREHERQLVYGELVLSQEAWEQQSAAMRLAYQTERTSRVYAEQVTVALEREVYHFIRTLEATDPEALEEVRKQISPGKIPNRFLNIPKQRHDSE